MPDRPLPLPPPAARHRVSVHREGFGPMTCAVDDGRTHRKQHGIFFTPWAVAERLADLLAPHLDRSAGPPTTCDPFAGVGVLLAALIERLAASDDAARAALLARAHAVDLDAAHLALARDAVFRGPGGAGADARVRAFDALATPLSDLAGDSWERAFPSVFAAGGFDAIITNPPWEKVRVNEREFFSTYDPDFSQRPRRERDARRAALLASPDVSAAHAAYVARVAELKRAAATQYTTSGSGGDLDTYKLAVERCVRLLRPGGVAGLIVPHGVLGDWGARGLRDWLLAEHELVEVVRMETGPTLFPEIHANLGVCFVVVRRGRPAATGALRLSPAVDHIDSLAASPRVAVPTALVLRATEHRAIPLVDCPEDVAFLDACARFPSLAEWSASPFAPGREVDMTNDRARFRPAASAAPGAVPLLEGKQLAPFQLDLAGRRFDLAGPHALSDRPRIAWRAVADRAMARRLVATWVPRGVALGNSLIYASADPDEHGATSLLWLLGWMSSRIADAQLRLWCSNNNINIFHVRACRVPEPATGTAIPELVRGLLAYRNPGAAWLPAGVAVSLSSPGHAREAVVALDESWRALYDLPDVVWERSVIARTAPISRWRGFA
jgi:hypothetical protein